MLVNVDIAHSGLSELEINFIYDFLSVVEDSITDDYEPVDDEETSEDEIETLVLSLSLFEDEDLEYFSEEDFRNSFKKVLPVLMDISEEIDGEKIYLLQGGFVSVDGTFITNINEEYLKLLEAERDINE